MNLIVSGILTTVKWSLEFIALNKAMGKELISLGETLAIVEGVVSALPPLEEKNWEILKAMESLILDIQKKLSSLRSAKESSGLSLMGMKGLFFNPSSVMKELDSMRLKLLTFFDLLQKVVSINAGIEFSSTQFLAHADSQRVWTRHFGTKTSAVPTVRFLAAIQFEMGPQPGPAPGSETPASFPEDVRAALVRILDTYNTQSVDIYTFASICGQIGWRQGLSNALLSAGVLPPLSLQVEPSKRVTIKYSTGGTYIGEAKAHPTPAPAPSSPSAAPVAPKLPMRHGRGLHFFADGNMIDGHFENDLMQGLAIYWFAKTGMRYYGTTEKNSMTGKGVVTWKNGNRYEGDVLRGKLHGKGSLLTPKAIYEGDFKDAYFAEGDITYQTDGRKYTGSVQKGLPHGPGTMTYLDGKVLKCNWINGLTADGEVMFKYADGRIYEGAYANKKLNGFGKMLWSPGPLDGTPGRCTREAVGTWKDNRPHGHMKVIYVDNFSIEGEFDEGKMTNSLYTYRYSEGDRTLLIEGTFEAAAIHPGTHIRRGTCTNVSVTGSLVRKPLPPLSGTFLQLNDALPIRLIFLDAAIQISVNPSEPVKKLSAAEVKAFATVGLPSADGDSKDAAADDDSDANDNPADAADEDQSSTHVEEDLSNPSSPSASAASSSAVPVSLKPADKVKAWLQTEALDEEYFPKFDAAGYDHLDIIADLTEQELVSDVGVAKPGHRKKLVKMIAELKISLEKEQS